MARKGLAGSGKRAKRSIDRAVGVSPPAGKQLALIDTPVAYFGNNLEQLARLQLPCALKKNCSP
jgi:hypothetical protein